MEVGSVEIGSRWYVDSAREGNCYEVVGYERTDGTERYTLRLVEARQFGAELGQEIWVEPEWFRRRGVAAGRAAPVRT